MIESLIINLENSEISSNLCLQGNSKSPLEDLMPNDDNYKHMESKPTRDMDKKPPSELVQAKTIKN